MFLRSTIAFGIALTVAFGALVLSSRVAEAQAYCPAVAPLCNTLPNPIYVASADTQVPVLQRIGKKLAHQVTSGGADNKTTVVYVSAGSCTNIPNLYATPPKFAGTPFFIPQDQTFDVTAKTACSCVMPTPPPAADMAITIVVPDNVSCTSNVPATPPAGITVFKGPVQGMTFVVPYDSTANVGSSQRAITAEEAYLVMGIGAEDAQVPPWSDRHYIYGRTSTKGTQVSIGANILVPAAKWQLLPINQIDQSADLAADVSALTADPNAEKVLGILGTEIYDKSRAKLHALAFRAYHQNHAYWPDSKLSAFDKANVRDGHYTLWSYVQYLAPTTGTPAQAKTAVQQIIDSLDGTSQSLTYVDPVNGQSTVDPIDDVIASGLVPQCAMKVQRPGGEGSDLSPYSAPAPCGCYFDNQATGATSCATCDTGHPCAGARVCRRGFCEAQ